MKSLPFLCLNMIVRNESHIIERTIRMLVEKIPEIDYYVISDTGSDDQTPSIIRQVFDSLHVQGEIYHDPWKDFGFNRSKALAHAYQKSKYLLIFDADDEIIGDFKLPNLSNIPSHIVGFNLQFGSKENGDTCYERTLLIHNQIRWAFKGVLHEYLYQMESNGSIMSLPGKYHLISGKTGSRSLDPQKYMKDAFLLEKAFEEALSNKDDLYHRYAFYCAQSFFDACQYEKSKIWYEKVLTLQGWVQEKYYACFRLYHICNTLKQEKEGLFYCVQAFTYDTDRYDCVFQLIRYYSGNDMTTIAWNYYQLIRSNMEKETFESNPPHQKLFYNPWFGYFGVPYYMVIVSIRMQEWMVTKRMYEIILNAQIPEQNSYFLECLFINLPIAFPHWNSKIQKSILEKCNSYLTGLEKQKVNTLKIKNILSSLNPSVKPKSKSLPISSSKPNILLYTRSMMNCNHRQYMSQALGGSETMILQLALALSNHYKVYLVANLEPEIYNDIQFIDISDLSTVLQSLSFYAIIVSRYIEFFVNNPIHRAEHYYVWAHDLIFHNQEILPNILTSFEKCICVSQWHKESLIKTYPYLESKLYVIPNAVDLSYDRSSISSWPSKVPYRFIYSSQPFRGLSRLLELWPSILQLYPEAELCICTYDTHDQSLMKTIQSSHNVRWIGHLKKSDLYDLLKTCDYWLYPCNQFRETSCITAMEMMMHRVLCLYYPHDALSETIGNQHGIPLEWNQEIKILQTITDQQKQEILDRAFEYSQKYTWKSRTQQWLRFLGQTEVI